MSYSYPSVVTLSKLRGRSLRRPIAGTTHATVPVFTDLGQEPLPTHMSNWYGFGLVLAVVLLVTRR